MPRPGTGNRPASFWTGKTKSNQRSSTRPEALGPIDDEGNGSCVRRFGRRSSPALP
jgi:hypothetical protein